METQPTSPTTSPRTGRSRRTSARWGRRAAVLVAVAVLPLTSACAANFGAQTQQQYQPGVGSDERDGDIYAINMLVVADGQGNGTVVGTLINQTDLTDYVTQFAAEDTQGGGIETSKLPPVSFGLTGATPDANAPTDGIVLAPQVPAKLPDDGVLQLQGDAVQPGTFVTLSLTFKEAAPLDLEVPVVTQTSIYDGVTVGPVTQPASTTPGATPSS